MIVKDPKRTGVKVTLNAFEEWPEFAEPGECAIFDVHDPERCVLHHACPGCGRFGGIRVGFTAKPSTPGWLLTGGDKTDPRTWTLSPSINCVGCCGWHGYLRNGVFESC